jgi:hypothetical protein
MWQARMEECAMDTRTLKQLCYREGFTPRLRANRYWYAHRKRCGQQHVVYLGTVPALQALDEPGLLHKLHRHLPDTPQTPPLDVEWLPGNVLRLSKAGRAINLDARDQEHLRQLLSQHPAEPE